MKHLFQYLNLTLYIPASHGIHLQVDVLNVTKGAEVLLDVQVLCLLGEAAHKQLPRRRVGVWSAATAGLSLQNETITKIFYFDNFVSF